MNILLDPDNPALLLLMGTGVTIGIATGVAYETTRWLRSNRKIPDSDKQPSDAETQMQLLTQMVLHQQQQEVQEQQQSMLTSIIDLNRQLTDAYREMALLKIELESLRDRDTDA